MTLRNPIQEMFDKLRLEGKIKEIPLEEGLKAMNKINNEMKKVTKEFEYKSALSRLEAEKIMIY